MSAVAPAALPSKVLLTGASRGIGAAIARMLLARGVRLAVVGRDRAALEAVVGTDSEHAVLIADLAIRAEVEPLADRAAAELGGLDGFVSCAGMVEYAELGAISAASLERQMAVNFTAPLLIAQATAQHIAAQGGGAMLLISSTLGLNPAPLTAAYAASKAALTSIARSLALELGGRSIRVNAIAPGVIDTDMVRALRPSSDHAVYADDNDRVAAQLEELRRLHPLERLGQTDDVAEAALYLLHAPYVTGTVMVVDGGLSLGSGRP
jgi:NAD(P)-dependent dehydrogenase (short-subunit alcohol dehydrogenase family)